MLSSVLFTGDAGGLNYVRNVSEENPAFFPSLCCTCTQDDISHAQTDLAPIRRSVVKKEAAPIELDAVEVDKDFIFRWSPALIAKYSNVSAMRRSPPNESSAKKKKKEINVYEQIANGLKRDLRDSPKKELQMKL